jgi:hypothetical protein
MPTSLRKLARRKGSKGDKQLAAAEYVAQRMRFERLDGGGRVGYAMSAAVASISAAIPRATTEPKRESLETTSGAIDEASHMTVKAACAAGTAAEIGANVASGLCAVTALGAAVTLDAPDGRAFGRDAFAGVQRNDERRDREAQYYADTDGDVPATYGGKPNRAGLTYGELRAKACDAQARIRVYDYSTREQDTTFHAELTTGSRARKARRARDAARDALPVGYVPQHYKRERDENGAHAHLPDDVYEYPPGPSGQPRWKAKGYVRKKSGAFAKAKDYLQNMVEGTADYKLTFFNAVSDAVAAQRAAEAKREAHLERARELKRKRSRA